ncbi:hypothetical protein [Microcoleus sp.]
MRANLTEEEGAENRLLVHTGMLADILAEHFDYFLTIDAISR